jgi:hypothetical protein
LRTEGEVLERDRGVLEAGIGGADLGEAILEEVDLQIRLLLEPLQLLHAQLVQLDADGVRHDRCRCLSRRRLRRSGGCEGKKGRGEIPY